MKKNYKLLQTAALVFGPMGTGKTEIAKKLAKEKKLVYITPDMFWDRASGIKFTREIGDKNFAQAYGEMIYCIERKKSFILDSALRRNIDRREVTTVIRDLDYFINNLGFKIIGFYIKSDLELCLKRNSLREDSQPEFTIKKYHKYFEKEIPSKLDGFDEFYTIENNGENFPDLNWYADKVL